MNKHAHSSSLKALLRRRDIRNVPCPECGAAAGSLCVGKRNGYKRAASHKARISAWRTKYEP